MFTYSTQLSLYQKFTKNSSAENQSTGNILIQQYTLELLHKYPFINAEQTFTSLQTFPSQQFYNLPANLRKVGTLTINVGGSSGFNWPVLESPSRQHWNNLNLTNNITSDIPQYFTVFNNQIGIYPRPATGYNPITITGQVEVASTSVSDYTTGTITTLPFSVTFTTTLALNAVSGTLSAVWSLPTGSYQIVTSAGGTVLATFTNGSTAVTWLEPLTAASTATATIRTALGGDIVVGSGTSWITGYANFVFQISEAQGGDNFYYRIAQVYDSTHLSLTTPYNGAAISAGSATYSIGEASIIPAAYQLIPVYRAAELYWTTILSDTDRQAKYQGLADTLEASMRADYGNKSTDPTIEDGEQKPIINPNLTISTTGSTGS